MQTKYKPTIENLDDRCLPSCLVPARPTAAVVSHMYKNITINGHTTPLVNVTVNSVGGSGSALGSSDADGNFSISLNGYDGTMTADGGGSDDHEGWVEVSASNLCGDSPTTSAPVFSPEFHNVSFTAVCGASSLGGDTPTFNLNLSLQVGVTIDTSINGTISSDTNEVDGNLVSAAVINGTSHWSNVYTVYHDMTGETLNIDFTDSWGFTHVINTTIQ